MKRVLSSILLVCILCLYCAPVLAADDSSQTATVIYQQWQNGQVLLANQSPAHYGDINSGETLWPTCYVGQITSVSAATVYPDSITVDISNDLIRRGNCVVYLGMYNAWTTFMGSTDYHTYFEWVDSVPGYRYRGSVSTSMGFAQVTSISANTPSNVSVAVRRMASGASGGASLGNVTPFASRTPNQHYVTHEASNGNSSEPSWVVASNSLNLFKVAIDSSSDERDTVRFSFDSNDITSCTASQSISGTHLISGVFVPLALVVDTTNYSNDMLDLLDQIVDQLVDLNQNVSDGFTNVVSILNDNFADILASIGTSTGSRDNMLYYLNTLVTTLSHISAGLEHQTTPNALSSSVQYIEYYLSRVLANTDIFVQYIENITDTMEAMEDEIDDANDAIDGLSDDISDTHEQEEQIYDDANDAIGNLAISDYDFDYEGWTGQGVRFVGDLFDDLWDVLGPYAQVYSFALMLIVAFTIIRYSTRRAKAKDKSGNNGENP